MLPIQMILFTGEELFLIQLKALCLTKASQQSALILTPALELMIKSVQIKFVYKTLLD
jgi:hypothetical protein